MNLGERNGILFLLEVTLILEESTLTQNFHYF